jgi:hypothetical protein
VLWHLLQLVPLRNGMLPVWSVPNLQGHTAVLPGDGREKRSLSDGGDEQPSLHSLAQELEAPRHEAGGRPPASHRAALPLDALERQWLDRQVRRSHEGRRRGRQSCRGGWRFCRPVMPRRAWPAGGLGTETPRRSLLQAPPKQGSRSPSTLLLHASPTHPPLPPSPPHHSYSTSPSDDYQYHSGVCVRARDLLLYEGAV